MSRAGTKSSQGDDYQRLVAMHWLIRLLNHAEQISYIQAESNGLPDIDEKITVDDVVVVYESNRRRHIQVKKNHPQNRCWSLSDKTLIDELPKIREQLESSTATVVELYSRTPFGDLQSLADACREYPDLNAFNRQSGEVLHKTLAEVAKLWNRSEAHSFGLLQRLEFATPYSFEDFERQNRMELGRLVSHAGLAMPFLESFLNAHQSKLQATSLIISRDDVIRKLEQSGVVRTPMRSEVEIIAQFETASRIGREWERTVGGVRIERVELGELLQLIEGGANTILVTDRPGSGKTCLLLDLADRIEQDQQYGLLFIKGDRFVRLRSDEDFEKMGLPEDVVGLCSRLSEYRRVIVIIDSLDVLSINRDHGALGVFLRLIDRLQPVQNVTVIAACRSFDLQYDPLLRSRKWTHEVHLAEFDFGQVVVPLLHSWGIQEEQLDAQLRHLLQLPQNLRLFEAIIKHGERWSIRTVYELHEAYIEEVIHKAPNLGDRALSALYTMADRLLRDRDHLLSAAAFPADESVRRALVSSGVLFQEEDGCLGFSHQTLFDTLAARSSIASGKDLVEFIKAHPPFPFLRPAVRTLVFYFRAHAPKRFPREVRAVLSDPDIAYHFKRLIVESLTEIVPQDDDWPLVNWLFREQPELFRRLFWRLEGEDWFTMLISLWLPSLGSLAVDGEWYSLFATRLDRWMDSRPHEVIELWHRALSEVWGDKDALAWRIVISLHKFEQWETEGIVGLIETLLKETKAERDLLGKVISRYVIATNKGDELLWRYIVKDVSLQDIPYLSFKNELHCAPHDFHDKVFFERRLVDSIELLNLTLKSLDEWASNNILFSEKHQLRSIFLHNSSWELRHSRKDMHHVGSLEVLLQSIELAIKHHANLNDQWWQEHEPRLRGSLEVTFLYFLSQAYKENPATNLDGIAVMLTNKELLGYGQLEHELGELIQASYHLLPPEVQGDNQRTILKLDNEEAWGQDGLPSWTFRVIFQYLIRIPCIFRLPESQSFIERFERLFGKALSEPDIHSWSGGIGFPVPLDEFQRLSHSQLLRLLDYYTDYKEHSSHPADDRNGGREMVERSLGEAAAQDPAHYLSLVPEIVPSRLHGGYLRSLLLGVANHLRYRFGRLQPPDHWKPVEPQPEGPDLARSLLHLAERCQGIWEDGYTISHILEACCETAEDSDSAERLVFLMFRLLRHSDPKEDRQVIFSKDKQEITSQDLRNQAINSVRGIAAGTAMTLCNRLLELGIEPPELLFPLLRHFARDPVLAVRAALLGGLPYLTYKRHEWGWQVFGDIFREPQKHLWLLAERHLYHQYQAHFSLVVPYLDRMCAEAPQEAACAWGRISALALLSGHMGQEKLFAELATMSSPAAWKGAAQVFVANLDRHEGYGLCIHCLKRILQDKSLDKATLHAVESAFEAEERGRFLDRDFVLHFIDAMQPEEHGYDLRQFIDWIADLSIRNPVEALEVCEQVVAKLNAFELPHRLWHTEPLISALSCILREADQADNEELIRRAVRLQDKFLQMDIPGIEDFFNNAARL